MRNSRWALSERWRLWRELLAAGKGVWRQGLDQDLLGMFLWPRASLDMVAHDSYTCTAYPSPMNRPFPTKRNSSEDFLHSPGRNLVGSDNDDRTIDLQQFPACPPECRPKDHQDWLLC
jgi:hypothetical protein